MCSTFQANGVNIIHLGIQKLLRSVGNLAENISMFSSLWCRRALWLGNEAWESVCTIVCTMHNAFASNITLLPFCLPFFALCYTELYWKRTSTSARALYCCKKMWGQFRCGVDVHPEVLIDVGSPVWAEVYACTVSLSLTNICHSCRGEARENEKAISNQLEDIACAPCIFLHFNHLAKWM